MAVIVVLFTTVTLVARLLPKRTVSPLKKFVPVRVMLSPPAILPEVGEIALKVGAAAA
jgi:hypothetical protein